jgi:hypothetical protein
MFPLLVLVLVLLVPLHLRVLLLLPGLMKVTMITKISDNDAVK